MCECKNVKMLFKWDIIDYYGNKLLPTYFFAA